MVLKFLSRRGLSEDKALFSFSISTVTLPRRLKWEGERLCIVITRGSKKYVSTTTPLPQTRRVKFMEVMNVAATLYVNSKTEEYVSKSASVAIHKVGTTGKPIKAAEWSASIDLAEYAAAWEGSSLELTLDGPSGEAVLAVEVTREYGGVVSLDSSSGGDEYASRDGELDGSTSASTSRRRSGTYDSRMYDSGVFESTTFDAGSPAAAAGGDSSTQFQRVTASGSRSGGLSDTSQSGSGDTGHRRRKRRGRDVDGSPRSSRGTTQGRSDSGSHSGVDGEDDTGSERSAHRAHRRHSKEVLDAAGSHKGRARVDDSVCEDANAEGAGSGGGGGGGDSGKVRGGERGAHGTATLVAADATEAGVVGGSNVDSSGALVESRESAQSQSHRQEGSSLEGRVNASGEEQRRSKGKSKRKGKGKANGKTKGTADGESASKVKAKDKGKGKRKSKSKGKSDTVTTRAADESGDGVGSVFVDTGGGAAEEGSPNLGGGPLIVVECSSSAVGSASVDGGGVDREGVDCGAEADEVVVESESGEGGRSSLKNEGVGAAAGRRVSDPRSQTDQRAANSIGEAKESKRGRRSVSRAFGFGGWTSSSTSVAAAAKVAATGDGSGASGDDGGDDGGGAGADRSTRASTDSVDGSPTEAESAPLAASKLSLSGIEPANGELTFKASPRTHAGESGSYSDSGGEATFGKDSVGASGDAVSGLGGGCKRCAEYEADMNDLHSELERCRVRIAKLESERAKLTAKVSEMTTLNSSADSISLGQRAAVRAVANAAAAAARRLSVDVNSPEGMAIFGGGSGDVDGGDVDGAPISGEADGSGRSGPDGAARSGSRRGPAARSKLATPPTDDVSSGRVRGNGSGGRRERAQSIETSSTESVSDSEDADGFVTVGRGVGSAGSAGLRLSSSGSQPLGLGAGGGRNSSLALLAGGGSRGDGSDAALYYKDKALRYRTELNRVLRDQAQHEADIKEASERAQTAEAHCASLETQLASLIAIVDGRQSDSQLEVAMQDLVLGTQKEKAILIDRERELLATLLQTKIALAEAVFDNEKKGTELRELQRRIHSAGSAL